MAGLVAVLLLAVTSKKALVLVRRSASRLRASVWAFSGAGQLKSATAVESKESNEKERTA